MLLKVLTFCTERINYELTPGLSGTSDESERETALPGTNSQKRPRPQVLSVHQLQNHMCPAFSDPYWCSRFGLRVLVISWSMLWLKMSIHQPQEAVDGRTAKNNSRNRANGMFLMYWKPFHSFRSSHYHGPVLPN
jgi:hypothetical protein